MPDECDVLEDDCFAVERVVAEVGVGEGDRASLNVQGMTILCQKKGVREVSSRGSLEEDSGKVQNASTHSL